MYFFTTKRMHVYIVIRSVNAAKSELWYKPSIFPAGMWSISSSSLPINTNRFLTVTQVTWSSCDKSWILLTSLISSPLWSFCVLKNMTLRYMKQNSKHSWKGLQMKTALSEYMDLFEFMKTKTTTVLQICGFVISQIQYMLK